MEKKVFILPLFLTTILAQYSTAGLNSVILPTTPTAQPVSQPSNAITIPTYPTANISSLKTDNSKTSSNNNIYNTINSAKNQLSTPVQSSEALWTRVPSKAELTKIVEDGDIAAITKTIQTLASDDSIPCSDKVCYLLELLGLVKAAIQKKSLSADQLATIVSTAQAEINRLNGEIKRIQDERDKLRIPYLEANISDFVSKLQNLYDQTNAVKVQIPPEEARILGYEKEISTYSKQNDEERRKISNDKLKLVENDNLIKDLESRLKDAKDTKASLETSISKSEGLIADNSNKINNIRTTISDINAKIKSLQDTFDRLKRESNQLEVDLERARTDLSVGKVKDENFANEISKLNDLLNKEKPKLASEDDLNKLRTLITNLNNILPQIQNAIDREFYYCYGDGKVQTETVGNIIVYIVKSEAFANYIASAYGQSVTTPNVRSTDYKFKVSGSSSYLSKTSEFSCLSSNNFSTGKGQITSIAGSNLTVKDSNGSSVTLNIGSCSRVESTSQAPGVGQNIAWKGTGSGTGSYNVFTATCW